MIISICGVKKAVGELSQRVSDALAEIEKKVMENTRNITKKVKLKMFQLSLLNSVRFFDPKNFSGFGVTLNVESREITFEGQKSRVDQVITSMYEQLKAFTKTSFPASKGYKDMMFEKEVRDYIKRKMIQQKIIGVWDVVKGEDQVHMYSKTEKQAQTAVDIVLKCLLQKIIPLDLTMEEIIYGDPGKDMIAKLTTNHQGLLKFEKSTGQLLVITVDYLMNEICEEVKQFLDLHVIRDDFMNVSSGTLCFIDRFCRDRLEHIENQYKSLSVIIELVDAKSSQGFKIRGKKDGRTLAVKQLQKLIENVCTEEHSITSSDVDVNQFFQSTQGRNELYDIELKEKCVLKIKPDSEQYPRSADESHLKERAVCTVKSCKIIVLEGDITELKVDAIVNPRNIVMTNNEGLSGTIINKGKTQIDDIKYI